MKEKLNTEKLTVKEITDRIKNLRTELEVRDKNSQLALIDSMQSLINEFAEPRADTDTDWLYFKLCWVIRDAYAYADQHNIDILDVDIAWQQE